MTRVTETANQFLSAVSAKLKIPAGRLDANGEALLECVVDGARVAVRVVARETSATLSFTVPVGRLPTTDDGTLGRALLAGNLAGVATHGLAFAFSPQDETLHLSHSLHLPGATYAAFEAALTRIISVGLATRRRFADTPAMALPPSVT